MCIYELILQDMLDIISKYNYIIFWKIIGYNQIWWIFNNLKKQHAFQVLYIQYYSMYISNFLDIIRIWKFYI